MKSNVLKLFRTAIGAVDPYACVKHYLVFNDDEKKELQIGDNHITLNHNLYVAAFGKAALGMCRAVDDLCHKHIIKGIASVPVGTIEQAKRKDGIYPSWKCSFDVYEGAQNNLPDQAAMKTAQRIQTMISNTMSTDDILLVLISGGGSALLPLPIDVLTLEEKYQMIKLLQSKGANIQELNTVRQAMSQLKNGGLARMAKSKTIIALILSDVIGDPLEFIASGPTFYSGNKNQLALDIFNKYDLIDHIPTQFLQHLKENAKNTHDQSISSNKQIHNLIVGSNRIALEAAAHLCRQSFTYAPFIMTNCLQGEAREVAHHIVELVIKEPSELVYNDKIACLFSDKSTFDAFQTFVKEHKHYCLLLGGETTVVMKNGAGKGGRCQELALAAALSINENNKNVSIGLLAAGSDGIDGPTDAAGAFVFKGMFINKDDIQRAHAALDKHDAYTYLNETNNGENLLKIGHTNTNVMDIIIVLVDREKTTP